MKTHPSSTSGIVPSSRPRRRVVDLPSGLRVAGFSAGPFKVAAASAPPLVLLHGLGADSGEWILPLPLLARSRAVLALDLLGHGGSSIPLAPGVGFRLRLLADAVAEAVERLAPEGFRGPVHLLGHSLGGAVALDLARRFPRLVDRLVLVDAAWIPSAASLTPLSVSLPFVPNSFQDSQRLLKTSVNSTLLNNPLVALGAALYKGRRRNRSQLLKLVASIASGQDVVTPKELSRLRQRTLVLWGSGDRIFPLATGRRLASYIPGSRLEIIPGCGHVPPTERPVAFARRVNAFLESP